MSTSSVDRLVSDYLERLDRAAQGLPPDRRTELLDEIGEHIEAARAAGAAADEAAVRTLLDRLGEPAEIVAAARDEHDPGFSPWEWRAPSQPLTTVRPSTVLETWAVVMLTLGSLIPVAGWLVGVVLLWLSQRWRWWEKLIGTLVVPCGPGLVLLLGSLVTNVESCSAGGSIVVGGRQVQRPPVCTSSGPPLWLTSAMVVFIVVAPIVVGIVLLTLARRRAGREPAVLRALWTGPAPGGSPWSWLETVAVVTLGIGAFVVPIVGPAVGLALAWCSPRWSDREKTTATLIAIVPLLVSLLGFAALLG